MPTTSAHKQKWLERFAGPKDDVTEPVPLRIPPEDKDADEWEVLDADKYYVVLRYPTGVELDELDSLRSREITERETVIDELNPENSIIREKRYYEFSASKLIRKCVELGLIKKCVTPDRNPKGEIVEQRLTGDPVSDWKIISKYPPELFESLLVALNSLWSQEQEQVVQEGEESSGNSESSTQEQL